MGGGFVSILLSVLAITTIVGVGLAGLQQGITKNLREALSDNRGRLTDVTGERDDLERERDRYKILVEKQAADMEALSKVVTGEAHLVAIAHQMQENHQEVLAAIKRVSEGTR